MRELEELLHRYAALIRLLEEEEEKIELSLGGELGDAYRAVLQEERQDVEKNLALLKKDLE